MEEWKQSIIVTILFLLWMGGLFSLASKWFLYDWSKWYMGIYLLLTALIIYFI